VTKQSNTHTHQNSTSGVKKCRPQASECSLSCTRRESAPPRQVLITEDCTTMTIIKKRQKVNQRLASNSQNTSVYVTWRSDSFGPQHRTLSRISVSAKEAHELGEPKNKNVPLAFQPKSTSNWMRTPGFVPERVRELKNTSSTSRIVHVKIKKHRVFGKEGQQK